jgi:hypothetical protein
MLSELLQLCTIVFSKITQPVLDWRRTQADDAGRWEYAKDRRRTGCQRTKRLAIT